MLIYIFKVRYFIEIVELDVKDCLFWCMGKIEVVFWFLDVSKGGSEIGLFWRFIGVIGWYWDVGYVFGCIC